MYIYNKKSLLIFRIFTPKVLFRWEDTGIVYKHINCSVYSWLSNNQATQTSLIPVSLTEQNVRKGHKPYVSPHTRRAQSYQHCSVILHSK